MKKMRLLLLLSLIFLVEIVHKGINMLNGIKLNKRESLSNFI
jgi:hypothetical protein